MSRLAGAARGRGAGPAGIVTAQGLKTLVGRAALALAALLLAGCSLMGTRTEASSAAAAPGERLVPVVHLVVEAPAPLKALLEQHLDLARLQSLPEGETLSNAEWSRLLAGAPAQARELLQTEGYFDALVQIQRTPPAGTDALPTVRVQVTPGPRVAVTRLQVQAAGELAQRAMAGDADARALREGLAAASVLQAGRPFRNPDWSESKQQVLARLRSGGYAAARLSNSAAEVDPAVQQARLSIEVDSGPLFRAGEVQVSGLKHHEAATVRAMADFGVGSPLTEARLLDYQDRLRRSGLFQSSSVGFDPDPAQAAAAPLRVRVTEQPLQQAIVGLGYSDNTGPRATIEHTHRRPFDRPWVVYNKLEWGRDRQSWTGDLQSHPKPGFYRDLLGVQIERELSDTDVVLSQRLRLGRTQDTPRMDRLAFVELLHSRKNELAGSGPAVTAATALTANLHLVWRQLDNVLLPTQGYTLSLQGSAGQASSRTGPDGPVFVLYGRLTAYRPIGAGWHAQARIEAGQVVKAADVDYPDALGFRAGGDDSVRGYAWRSLAPVDGSGRTVSGRSLFTSSIELARPISDRYPSLWGAVFVDAGRAVDSWKGLRPAVGYGAGIRWRSPIGPLNVDLAHGHELQRWRLHLSVGIAF